MATSTVLYKGSLRTECTHLRSGSQIITDAPVDNHGKGEAFSPTDLVATALGSCMISIMGIVAMKNNFLFEGGSVEITKIMAEGPRRIAEIVAVVRMPGLPFTPEQKKMLENAAIHCPVAKSIHPGIRQT
ncbi:MAG: OsmC family protein, partial [Bacteroidota bacterium]